jgi:hypothetical protein
MHSKEALSLENNQKAVVNNDDHSAHIDNDVRSLQLLLGVLRTHTLANLYLDDNRHKHIAYMCVALYCVDQTRSDMLVYDHGDTHVHNRDKCGTFCFRLIVVLDLRSRSAGLSC